MSRTPEVIISKPLKAVHDTVAGFGGFFLLVSAFHFAQGNNGILQLLIAGGLFWLASKVKYQWTKKGEVGFYD